MNDKPIILTMSNGDIYYSANGAELPKKLLNGMIPENFVKQDKTKNTHGGKRAGSGRKKLGRKPVNIRLTETEYAAVKQLLIKLRGSEK